MQGAKTSKNMLLCQRRVHLHKSASFKTIFHQIPQIIIKHDFKIDPNMIDKSIKQTSKNIRTKHIEQITNFQMLAPILEPVN